MKKIIKNYTTTIPVDKTLSEIHKLLAENGARGIATNYDDKGLIKDVFFKVVINEKELPFRLPSKPDKVYKSLFAGKGQEWKYKEIRTKQAEQIAWRICKSWLEAQLTLINLEQASLEEVFLPYLVMPTQKTLFETMKDNQFLLPSVV